MPFPVQCRCVIERNLNDHPPYLCHVRRQMRLDPIPCWSLSQNKSGSRFNPSRENQYPIVGPEKLRVLTLVFEDRPVADLSLADPRQCCV